MGRKPRQKKESIGYTSGWYDWKTECVNLGWWQGDVRRIDEIQFPWYFFMTNDDIDMVRCRKFDLLVDDVRACKAGKYSRVYVPWANRDGRDVLIEWLKTRGAKPYEADVDPVTRYIAENPIQFAKPRVLMYDLETDPRLGWVTNDKGQQRAHSDSRILSIAWSSLVDGSEGFERMTRVDPNEVNQKGSMAARAAERRVLEAFMRAMSTHDMMVAWNGNNFDEPHTRTRAKALDLYPAWRVINFLDLMEMFKHPYYGFGRDAVGSGVKVSYALENIAQTVLGHGKVAGVPGHKMFEVWRDKPALMKKYNLRDVQIMAELEQKTGYIETHTVLSNLCNRFPSKRTVDSSNYLGDGMLLRWGSENNRRFPTRHHEAGVGENEKIEGAYVMDPVIGLHEEVCCLDVGSLYPNLIRAFNISPDVLLNTPEKMRGAPVFATATGGAMFNMDRVGAVPAVLEITLGNRVQFKKAMKAAKPGTSEYTAAKNRSDAWKVASNFMYGLEGSPWSRIYSRACAEAVTKSGQVVIKEHVIARADENGIKALAGDTDSGFLKCNEQRAKEFLKVFAKSVDEWVGQQGGKTGLIRLGIDAVYKRIFWTGKKRYAGIMTNGTWDVKGLELVRTDGCKYMRELQRRVIEFILETDHPTPETAEKIILSWAKRLHEGDYEIQDLASTVGLGKPLDQYKVETLQSRIAKQMLERGLEVYPGMKIQYIVLGLKGGKVVACHVDEFDKENFDAYHFWRTRVYEATHRILDAVFPEQKLLWKGLGKHNPKANQSELFGSNKAREEIDLVFRSGDELKFDKVMATLKRYVASSGRPIALILQTPDGDIKMSVPGGTLLVRPSDRLFNSLKRVVGHRVYFGGGD
jgi:DNA polymerase elongation subunit (family B)